MAVLRFSKRVDLHVFCYVYNWFLHYLQILPFTMRSVSASLGTENPSVTNLSQHVLPMLT